ncbi:MAG: hypothetical protein ABGY41_19335 [Candidatus Poribacteria bacterium]
MSILTYLTAPFHLAQAVPTLWDERRRLTHPAPSKTKLLAVCTATFLGRHSPMFDVLGSPAWGRPVRRRGACMTRPSRADGQSDIEAVVGSPPTAGVLTSAASDLLPARALKRPIE